MPPLPASPPPPPPPLRFSTFYGIFTYVFIWRCIWPSTYSCLRKVTSFCCRQPTAVPQVAAASQLVDRAVAKCAMFAQAGFLFLWVSLSCVFYTDFGKRMIRGLFKLNPVSLLNSCHRIEILFMQFMSYSQEMNFCNKSGQIVQLQA